MTTIERLYGVYCESHTVTTDSRQITPGCIFFALKGERFDGNAFVEQALAEGAALCVASDRRFDGHDRVAVVDDVLATLQELARHHRRHLAIPVIGITGTNGKTTTKELINAVLSRRYSTACTAGNHNNHIGVPLTLLAIGSRAQVAIVEMGANHPREIEQLCSIADPDCGLVTNVGRAHLEGFGGFEGVVRTKTELYRHIAQKSGTLFVNADNERLMREAEPLATIPPTESPLPAYMPATPVLTADALAATPLTLLTYGSSPEAVVHGSPATTAAPDDPYMRFYFEVGDRVYTVHTHLLGNYNFDNCMAAVAVGLFFGVEPFDIKEAIEGYVPQNQRSEYKVSERGNRLYLDCYNANPSSMAAAIESFRIMGGTMAIIGGMRELGRESRMEHQKLVDMLESCKLDRCLLIGHEFDGLDLPSGMVPLPSTDAAAEWLGSNTPHGATILIKGSNGNRLWTLENLL